MKSLIVITAAAVLFAVGCGKTDSQYIPAQVPPSKAAKIEPIDAAPKEGGGEVAANTGGVAVAAKAGGWGTLKGQIVFDGDIPKQGPLDVNRDQQHCLSKGPVPNEEWVVNPTNKGVRWMVLFLRPDQGKTLPIHENLKASKGDAEIDQPQCAFVPHVLTMREDQKLIFKNPAPVSHTATLWGFKNEHNVTLPPMKDQTVQVQAERIAIRVSCGIHPWMQGWVWVFDHPYHAVTDADGKFEIKLAPSGPQRLMIWHETGWLGGKAGSNGKAIEIKADGVTDLGVFKIKPGE